MQKFDFCPDKRLAVTLSTRNVPGYRDAAVILIDQLKAIYIDGQLETIDTTQWYPRIMNKDFTVGLNVSESVPADRRSEEAVCRTFPAARIALICGAIALLSLASVAAGLTIKVMLITATIVAFVQMMRIDRRAATPLLPSDAFSLRSPTGAALDGIAYVRRIQPAERLCVHAKLWTLLIS